MENWLRNPRVQGAGDAVLAALLAISSVIPVLAAGDPSWGLPKALGVALGLLSTVPVAWRARRPQTAFVIVLFANGACIYAAVPHGAAFQPFVALDAHRVLGRQPGRGTAGAVGAAAGAAAGVGAGLRRGTAARPGLRQHHPVPRLAGGGVGGRAGHPQLAAQERGAGSGKPAL